MIKMEPFTQETWLGLAGAEPFADGSEPFGGEILLADPDGATWLASVVLDAAGLTIERPTEDGGHDVAVDFVGEHIGRALCALRPTMTVAELRALPGARNRI